ncbi:MAG: hypothetical protein DHS20C13_27870 [Thermodesulfobacteriota bacterium]|nr:MAG: hypothetical protein DHS20C13_27870 [Thermodesulfobacteriota bacterium]
MTKKHIEFFLAFLTISGFCIAFPEAYEKVLETYFGKIPDDFYRVIFIGGILFLIAAISILIHAFFAHLRDIFPDNEYDCSVVSYNEISQFLECCKYFIGCSENELPTIERVQSWYLKNKNILYFVKKKKNHRFCNSEKIVGCFGILPVTIDTAKKLSTNCIKGNEFQPENVTKPTEAPAGYYIGVVAANNNSRDKYNTLLSTKANILGKIDNHKVPIYTRPMTEKGFQLVCRHKFKPVILDFSRRKDIIYENNSYCSTEKGWPKMKTLIQRLNIFKLGFYVLSHRERLGVGLKNRCYAGIAILNARERGSNVLDYYGIPFNTLKNAVKINNKANQLYRNVIMFFHSLRLTFSLK